MKKKKIKIKNKLKVHNYNYFFRIFNIGNNRKTKLLDFLKILEKNFNKKARIKYDKLQMGDVRSTVASNTLIKIYIKMKKATDHEIGIKNFVEWFINYFPKYKK